MRLTLLERGFPELDALDLASHGLKLDRAQKLFGFGKKLGLFFEAFNVFNTGNYGNQFQNTTGEPDFGKPINFFGATGFSEPLGIPFQAQLGVRFSF